MSDETNEKKPEPTAVMTENQVYTTAAAQHGMEDELQARPKPGLSFTPALQEIEGSKVPDGEHNHVMGPQQAPVDPVRAGLDTEHRPLSRSENRVITKSDDNSLERAPSDVDVARAPGPGGVLSKE